MSNLLPLSRVGRRLRSTCARLCPVLATVAAIGLSACGEPLHPSKWQTSPDEIPEGEGLFTGEDGAWTIYREN